MAEIVYSLGPITHAEVQLALSKFHGVIPNLDPYIDQCLYVRQHPQFSNKFIYRVGDEYTFNDRARAALEDIALQREHKLAEKIFFYHLGPERNIIPEKATHEVSLSESGRGATSTIQFLLHHKNGSDKLVTEVLLNALNEIFKNETHFHDIAVKQDGDQWEVFLSEDKKGRIFLSDSGSGLKSVLLVLISIEILPQFNNQKLATSVYAFEELENHLHPRTFRGLLSYIRRTAMERGATFFLTSHSSVAIDFFSRDIENKVIHLKNNGESSVAQEASDYVQNLNILRDLDARPSDILQANSVVWVEGPSDRIFFNRWIELMSDGKLKEGVHYQCVFYGGKILSHHESSNDFFSDEKINVLRLNQNAVFLMDRDTENIAEDIRDTKKRINLEVNSLGGYVWITNCREIENYVPDRIVTLLYPGVSGLKQFEKASDFFDRLPKNISKVDFAKLVAGQLTLADMSLYDLVGEIKLICEKIAEFNGEAINF